MMATSQQVEPVDLSTGAAKMDVAEALAASAAAAARAPSPTAALLLAGLATGEGGLSEVKKRQITAAAMQIS